MATSSTTKKIGDYLIDTDIDHRLGKTYTSVVYEGKHATSGDEVAGKMIDWLKGVPTDMIDTEAQLMKDLPPHENVLKLFQYTKKEVGENVQLWLIIEKCQLGDLGKFAQKTRLDLKQKIDLFLQCAKGLNHIHKNNLVHRDIKMENVLVHGSSKNPVIKIADFGISRIIEREMTQMTTMGTGSYKAPELHKKGKPLAGREVDTFSLGVTFLTALDPQDGEIITPAKVNKVPFGEYLHKHPNTDVAALITKPDDSDEVRRIKKHLIAAMMSPSPASRPSMQQVVEQLSEIHMSLCMKVLFAVNTAWESPVFCTDTDGLNDVKTSMSAKKTEPESEGAAATPHVSAINMKCVDKVTSEKVIGLLSVSEKEEIKDDILVAVDVLETEAVWIHTPVGWEKISDVPADCQGRCVCICEVPGGFVLLGGLDDKGKISSQCWLFSFSTRQWKQLQNMSMAKWWVSAAVVGDILLAAGGRDSEGNRVNVCERMDLISGEWSPAESLPYTMSGPLVAAAGGRVYIKDIHHHHFISYDPDTDIHTTITVSGIVPEYIWGSCMVSHNDKLYLLGGPWSLAVEYDPVTQKWLQLTPPSAMYDLEDVCCAVTRSKKILLCGGSTEGGRECDIMEEYDAPTNTWTQLDIRLPFKFHCSYCHVLKYST